MIRVTVCLGLIVLGADAFMCGCLMDKRIITGL